MSCEIFETEFEAPKWIDDIFLQKTLQHANNDRQVEIIEFNIQPATKKGENFASNLYRLSVIYQESFDEDGHRKISSPKQRNLIVKSEVDGDFSSKALREMNLFEKEMEFYNKIIPKMNSLLDQLTETEKLFAETFYVSKTKSAIVFEDLRDRNYGVKRSKEGFDLEHTKACLVKLAQFHGICAKLQENEPHIFKKFEHGLISRNRDTLNIMYLTLLDALVVLIETWPGFENIALKLKRFRPNLIEKCCQAFDAIDDHFNTLNHGDAWTTNFMLKYDQNSKLKDILLIDFQANCWASPAIDLHYLFGTSLSDELRLNGQDELLKFYHEKLTQILTQLNYRKHIPSFDELKTQFVAKSIYGFTSSCLVQPTFINDCKDSDIDCLILNDERAQRFKRISYESQRVQNNLRNLLPVYDKLGLFD